MYFCIVGTGRCGSTLLRNLINLHPDVFIFRETHWIPKMYEFFGTGYGAPDELLDIMLRTYFVTGDLVTPVDIEELKSHLASYERLTVAEFCNLVGSMCARKNNKRIWADKTPDYGPYMELIQRLWPDCKFIHLIRHGIDVVISMANHPGYQWMASAKEDNWVPASFNKYYTSIPVREAPLSNYSALWYRRLQRIRNEATRLKAGTYREVHLENLIDDPRTTLTSIMHFVGISSTEEWLDQAIPLIDTQRINQRAPERSKIQLQAREKELLHQLGYDG